MLTMDVIMENPFINSAIIDLANGHYIKDLSAIIDLSNGHFTVHEEQYNVTQCNYKGPVSLFVNKAVGL